MPSLGRAGLFKKTRRRLQSRKQRETLNNNLMKLIQKLAIAALAIAGLAVATPAEASWHHHGGYYHHSWGPRVVVHGGYYPYYYGDPYYYDGPSYGSYYYGPGVTFGFGGHHYRGYHSYHGGYYHGHSHRR